MKINVSQMVEVDCVVDVTVTDLLAELSGGIQDGESRHRIQSLLGAAVLTLEGVPDGIINQAGDGVRKVVCERLAKQIERYRPVNHCEHGIKEGDWCEPCNAASKEAAIENNPETMQ